MPRIVTNALDGVDLTALSEGNHADGGCLYLQVIGNARSWILRKQIQGRRREIGLGSLIDVNLPDAREAARAWRLSFASQALSERPVERLFHDNLDKAISQKHKRDDF